MNNIEKNFVIAAVSLYMWAVTQTSGFAQPHKVETVKLGPGQWELHVDGQSYFIKGVVYNFYTVGDDHNKGTLRDWSVLDSNGNARVDVAYDSWVDQNSNNQQDDDEPAVGDWQLLKDMGANTIRVYQMPSIDGRIDHLYTAPGARLTFSHPPNKELFRNLYHRYGIMVAVGHFFGEWAIGSGARWEDGTDFTDPVQRKNLLECIRVMVEEHKDEPYTLIWIIGNENFNPRDQDNAESVVEAFLTLVNEAAQLIHQIDPNHPVAICNLADQHIADIQRYCPDVDIFGVNIYSRTFDPLWKKARAYFDRPVLITEYGLPVLTDNGAIHEKRQALHHQASWQDIVANRYGGPGVGNSIGGTLFIWCDQWSLSGDGNSHDDGGKTPVPGEEWFGVTSQGDGSHSPFMRQLRHSYRMYQTLWK